MLHPVSRIRPASRNGSDHAHFRIARRPRCDGPTVNQCAANPARRQVHGAAVVMGIRARRFHQGQEQQGSTSRPDTLTQTVLTIASGWHLATEGQTYISGEHPSPGRCRCAHHVAPPLTNIEDRHFIPSGQARLAERDILQHGAALSIRARSPIFPETRVGSTGTVVELLRKCEHA